MVCYPSLCLYLTSEKSAPLTQGYTFEIFQLDYSIYVIYFGPLIPISGININLNHKAFSPASIHADQAYCISPACIADKLTSVEITKIKGEEWLQPVSPSCFRQGSNG